MSKSSQPRLSDLQAIHRLSHECRDLGDSAVVWRTHFAGGLAKLIDADLVMTGEFANFTHARRDVGNAVWGFDHGFNPAGWVVAQQLIRDDPDYSVGFRTYAARRVAEDGVALTRAEMVSGREWEHSVEFQMVFRTIGVDAGLWCFRGIPKTKEDAHGLVFSRCVGRPNFTARQTAVVQECVNRFTGLLGGPLARFAEPSPSELPRRVRQVLACVLEGDSDKQVAARLGISIYTVKQYAKSIFDHFDVDGKLELLARWVKRGWGRGGWADGLA